MADDLQVLPFSQEDHIPFGDLSKVAPFVESPLLILRHAANLLNLSPGQTVYDLGCGTADFLLIAAEQTPGIKAFGIDIAQDLVDIGNQRAQEAKFNGVDHPSLVRCTVGSVFEDFEWIQDADKLFIYLVPRMLKLKPFQESLASFLEAGCSERLIVCYYYSLPGWEPSYVDADLKVYVYSQVPREFS